jgi:quercetin dioxygenase-like cupin family protein
MFYQTDKNQTLAAKELKRMTRTQRKAIGLTIVVGGVLSYLRSAPAQPGALQVIPLAQGYSPDRHLNLKTKGSSDVMQAKLTLQPLGEIGWHTHPGLVIIIATAGALTEHHSNGCISLHQAGSVIIEEPGEVHRIVNHSATTPAEGYATFILPTGTPPLLPATDPTERSCSPGQQH